MANSNVHAEAGAATIVDRVEGWGHTASSDSAREDNTVWGSAEGNSITATDASKETTAARVAKSLKARKAFKEDADPAIAERTTGIGGSFTGAGGADAQYGYDNMEDETPATLADPADYKNGVFFDEDGVAETGAGSNTAQTTTDTHALATGRTKDTRLTVNLSISDAAYAELDEDDDLTEAEEQAVVDAELQRTSIVDRTSGWGHTAGGYAARKDA